MDDLGNQRRWLTRFPFRFEGNIAPLGFDPAKVRWLRWDGQRFTSPQEDDK